MGKIVIVKFIDTETSPKLGKAKCRRANCKKFTLILDAKLEAQSVETKELQKNLHLALYNERVYYWGATSCFKTAKHMPFEHNA